MKLSIIMPIYNGEDYIRNTITNILNSQYRDFELVLVNDGSKDKSYNICREIASTDSRVKLINKANGGIADARNVGVNQAEGEYIGFCDQDDYIDLDSISTILNSHEEDIILFSTIKDYGERKEPCDTVACDISYNNKKDIFNYCIWPMVYPIANNGNVSYFGHVWQAVYKTEVIKRESIQFKRFISIEDDFIFLLEVLICASSVSLNQNVGYRWSINPKSTTYKKIYIQNMREKGEQYYQYISKILLKSSYFTDNLKYKYKHMSNQVLGVRLVINEANNSDFKSAIKIVKSYLKNNKDSFKGEFLGKGAARKSASYIFVLLKYNMSMSAILFRKAIVSYQQKKAKE